MCSHCHIEGLWVLGDTSEQQLSFPALSEVSEFIFLSYAWKDEIEAFLLPPIEVEAVLCQPILERGQQGPALLCHPAGGTPHLSPHQNNTIKKSLSQRHGRNQMSPTAHCLPTLALGRRHSRGDVPCKTDRCRGASPQLGGTELLFTILGSCLCSKTQWHYFF